LAEEFGVLEELYNEKWVDKKLQKLQNLSNFF
jgi:hypothetical protein